MDSLYNDVRSIFNVAAKAAHAPLRAVKIMPRSDLIFHIKRDAKGYATVLLNRDFLGDGRKLKLLAAEICEIIAANKHYAHVRPHRGDKVAVEVDGDIIEEEPEEVATATETAIEDAIAPEVMPDDVTDDMIAYVRAEYAYLDEPRVGHES